MFEIRYKLHLSTMKMVVHFAAETIWVYVSTGVPSFRMGDHWPPWIFSNKSLPQTQTIFYQQTTYKRKKKQLMAKFTGLNRSWVYVTAGVASFRMGWPPEILSNKSLPHKCTFLLQQKKLKKKKYYIIGSNYLSSIYNKKYNTNISSNSTS